MCALCPNGTRKQLENTQDGLQNTNDTHTHCIYDRLKTVWTNVTNVIIQIIKNGQNFCTKRQMYILIYTKQSCILTNKLTIKHFFSTGPIKKIIKKSS